MKWFEISNEDQKLPRKTRRVKTEAIDNQKKINDLSYPKNLKKNIFNFDDVVICSEKKGQAISPDKPSPSHRAILNL